MNETTSLFALLLLALLVGALIPVAYQAVQALRSARRFLDGTGGRFEEALREFTEATARINRIAAAVEAEGERLRPAIEAAASIGRTVEKMRDALQTASIAVTALAPAFLAGMRAFMDRGEAGGDEAAGGGGPEAPAPQGARHGD